jgi:hypothetical protein
VGFLTGCLPFCSPAGRGERRRACKRPSIVVSSICAILRPTRFCWWRMFRSGGDHRVETGTLRHRQELPICQPVSAHLVRGPHFVIREQSPQVARNVSPDRSRRMQSCDGDDPSNSLRRHALEDIVCNLLRRVIVGVFEDGPDGQARLSRAKNQIPCLESVQRPRILTSQCLPCQPRGRLGVYSTIWG